MIVVYLNHCINAGKIFCPPVHTFLIVIFIVSSGDLLRNGVHSNIGALVAIVLKIIIFHKKICTCSIEISVSLDLCQGEDVGDDPFVSTK